MTTLNIAGQHQENQFGPREFVPENIVDVLRETANDIVRDDEVDPCDDDNHDGDR